MLFAAVLFFFKHFVAAETAINSLPLQPQGGVSYSLWQ